MRRVLITGSRDWDDWRPIEDALRQQFVAHGPFVLVSGAAPRGVDDIAETIISLHPESRCTVERHIADWRPHGVYNPQAGKLRNSEMVAAGADVCLAFIRNGSPGATDCADKAEAAGIPTTRFEA